MVVYGHARKGFEYPLVKFAVITETDIWQGAEAAQKKKTYNGQRIQDFSELSIGDFVVHEKHGLGIYKGIEKVEVDRIVKDYIKIEYRAEAIFIFLLLSWILFRNIPGQRLPEHQTEQAGRPRSGKRQNQK